MRRRFVPPAPSDAAPSDAPEPKSPPQQLTLDDCGTPLHSVEFCVVDLETTGGSATDLGITEIGAVRVRGGEVVGEFQTLVNPGRPIPAYISVLTGLTDAMVAGAPRLSAALPSFLEFSQGAVMVAHNAPYDMGYLAAAAAALDYQWAPPAVVDTVKVARAVVPRGEVPNHKLATLAQHFRAATRPTHRALDDARATVDVLHALLERVGTLGVTSLEDLIGLNGRVSDAVRRKRHLADGLPNQPGVYLFTDDRGEALYVGTSKNIRNRVRTYFTASEQRSRMGEMVGLATGVTPIVCATPLEAAVRELRLIAERKPRYNRRSRFPEKGRWLKLTVEPAPRLSLVATAKDDVSAGAAYLGPISRRAADDISEVLQLAAGIRTCTERISATRGRQPCGLADLGRCCAPCASPEGLIGYQEAAAAARTTMAVDSAAATGAVMSRIAGLSREERFEEAAAWLARLRTFLRVADRTQQRQALADAGEVVAAEPEAGGWLIHVIRHGRLAGAARVAPGADPRPAVDAAVATAEFVTPPLGPGAAALVAETDLILTWLGRPGIRLVAVEQDWALPIGAAARDSAALSPSAAGGHPAREDARRPA
jgi:DNA polymerase-3 subunit epsilon